jgi:branched-chain amino acid transport system substrate-binding protein
VYTALARRRRMLVALALVSLSGFGMAGCGGDDGDDESSKTTPEAVAKQNPATGSEVVLGVLENEEQPEFTEGVRTAVDYLNREARGLLGHRIAVRACTTNQTPQQSIQCANELVRADSVAVILGEDRSADSAFPVYERAGVPVVTPRVVTNQELVNPVAVSLSPGIPGLVATIADYTRTELQGKGVVTAIAQGVPKDLLDQLVGGPLGAAGLDSNYVFFAHDNPNFSATFASAAQKQPDLVIADIDNNTECVPAMQALRDTGTSFKVFHVWCSDDSVLEAAGPLAEGQLFYGPLDSIAGVDSADAKTFEHIVDAYASGKSPSYNFAVAASTVITVGRVLEKQGGSSVTPKAILAAFEKSNGTKIFMGPPLECGKAKAFPRVCTLASRIFTVEDGEKKALTGYVSAPQYLPQG